MCSNADCSLCSSTDGSTITNDPASNGRISTSRWGRRQLEVPKQALAALHARKEDFVDIFGERGLEAFVVLS